MILGRVSWYYDLMEPRGALAYHQLIVESL